MKKQTRASLCSELTLQESRCHCGNLLARLGEEGIELKCRRCKRTVMIPWRSTASWHGLTVQWQKPEDELSEEVGMYLYRGR